MVASETLVAQAGVLHWRPVPGVQNHFLDYLAGAHWARNFRRVTASRRPIRFAIVG